MQELAKERRTLVFYEAPHRIVECLADMEACFGSERAATLARELTKTYETIIPATLGTLMYSSALWRARGSVQDTFATFDGMGGGNVNAMTPVIKQLLGIDRPQVA